MKALAVHGGAGALPRREMTAALAEGVHAGLHQGLMAGFAVLNAQGRSVDAVETMVAELEDCPVFNAGRGSAFTREGKVEMEASIMNGSDRQAGAALLLRRVRNPVKLARLVMEHTPHVTLAGEAAERFAQKHGLPLEEEAYFHTAYRWEAMLRLRGTEQTSLSEDVVANPDPDSPEAQGTTGAVAVDTEGNIAAATSSGGTTNKYAGRVGQACMVGAGVYADNATCAISCTGQGEAFMRRVAAYDVAALIEHRGMSLGDAVNLVVSERLPGRGGMIAVDRHGNLALNYNTEGMYRGWITGEGRVFTAIYETVREWPALS